MRGRISRAATLAAAAFVVPGAVPAAPAPPLIGANYNHYAVEGCDLTGGVLLLETPYARTAMRRQLAAMRAAGLETLRLFVWHMHDAANQGWGVVSSAGGRLEPQIRANLIWYAGAVRAAGFRQLTVVFGPQWTNDPISFPENRYDPSLFDENWNLIREVRPLVKQYGPASTHFDLLNEGGPSDYLATKEQLSAYLAQMYANYVDAFGNDDVTVSSIVAWNDQSRIANLIDTLRATGRPLPRWFEVHAGGPALLQDLQATDATLTAKGLSQPLVLGETSYDDPAGAAALRQFAASSGRPLAEVMEWPLRAGSSCQAVSVAAPYRADAYIAALTGSPPPTTLTLSVGPGPSFRLVTPYGQPLTALEAGTYSLVVVDRSTRQSLRLVGPGVDRTSGIARVGTVTWTLALRPGTYRYRSDRRGSRSGGSFVVLGAG